MPSNDGGETSGRRGDLHGRHNADGGGKHGASAGAGKMEENPTEDQVVKCLAAMLFLLSKDGLKEFHAAVDALAEVTDMDKFDAVRSRLAEALRMRVGRAADSGYIELPPGWLPIGDPGVLDRLVRLPDGRRVLRRK